MLRGQVISKLRSALAAPRREPFICWSRNFMPARELGSTFCSPSSPRPSPGARTEVNLYDSVIIGVDCHAKLTKDFIAVVAKQPTFRRVGKL